MQGNEKELLTSILEEKTENDNHFLNRSVYIYICYEKQMKNRWDQSSKHAEAGFRPCFAQLSSSMPNFHS